MTQESGSVEKPQQLTTRLSPLLTQELRPKAVIRGFQEVRTPRERRSSHTPQCSRNRSSGHVCWSWCEDIPTSDLWDRWGCWRSSHPSLLPCGLTARKTFSSLCSWSQSAESPRSWKEGLPRSFTDRGACLLGAGFLWLQHPPEGA